MSQRKRTKKEKPTRVHPSVYKPSPPAEMPVETPPDLVVPDPVQIALKVFESEWQTLPPLVRAATADAIARQFLQEARRSRVDDELSVAAGAGWRRGEVHRRFARAHDAVSRLFADLARDADTEAVNKGIDQDTGPEPRERVDRKTWVRGSDRITVSVTSDDATLAATR